MPRRRTVCGSQGEVSWTRTRLASSPADVWRDVCASNADDIGAALDLLIARLQQLRAELRGRRHRGRRLSTNAARWRAELMKGREILSRIFSHHVSRGLGRGSSAADRTQRTHWSLRASFTAPMLTRWCGLPTSGFGDRQDLVLLAHRPGAARVQRCGYENLEGGISSFRTSTARSRCPPSSKCAAFASPRDDGTVWRALPDENGSDPDVDRRIPPSSCRWSIDVERVFRPA